LRFSGISVDGNPVAYIPADDMSFVIYPVNLGYMHEGTFVATGSGAGYLTASFGGASTYISVTVGGSPVSLSMANANLEFEAYPERYVSGRVSLNGAFPRLEYVFSPSPITQAAYLTFYPAIAVPANAIALNMYVLGNNCGSWLRGRVRDASGRTFNIDFIRDIDFFGWQKQTALLPAAASRPFTLEQLYVVTLGAETSVRNEVSFTGLEAVISPQPMPNIPQGPVFRDPLWLQPGVTPSVYTPGIGLTVHTFADESAFGGFVSECGRFTAVRMTLYGGGLGLQWERFMPLLQSNNADVVVILLDANPLTAFRQSMEFELLHMALRSLQEAGRTVLVASVSPRENTAVTIRDGVRYINMAQQETGDRFNVWLVENNVRWSD